ncbi:hypothetical protein EV183_001646 [Coemansia sp. RSA 2336]|nr:hypothetical protein EV183_001646 [Coemansia sp. RSA 2336]
MVNFSVRSLAFMALSFVAAASPVAQGFGQAAPAAAAAPAAVNYAPPAAQNMPVADNRNRDIAYQAAPNVAPQQVNKPQGRPEEQCVMVPCSGEECFKNMTPQEQAEFKQQCEEMRREEVQKAGVNGKSRVAAGGVEMNYYKMYTLEEAAKMGIPRPLATAPPAKTCAAAAAALAAAAAAPAAAASAAVASAAAAAAHAAATAAAANGLESTWVLEQGLESEPQLSMLSNENNEFVVTQVAASSPVASTEWVADLHTSLPQAHANVEPASGYQANEQQSDRDSFNSETPTSANCQRRAQSQSKHMNSWVDMPKIVYHPSVNGTQGYWGPEGMYPFDNVIMRFGDNNEHLAYGTMFINDTVVDGLHPYIFMGNDTLIDGWMVIGNDTTALNKATACAAAAVARVAAAAVHAVAAAVIAATVAIAAAATAVAASAAIAAATAAVASLAVVVASPAAASHAAASAAIAASLAASPVASNVAVSSSAVKAEKAIMAEKGAKAERETTEEKPPPPPPGPEGPGPNGPEGPGGPEGEHPPPMPPPPPPPQTSPMPSKQAHSPPSKSPPPTPKTKIVVNQKVPITLPNANCKLPAPGYATRPGPNRISIYNIHSQPSTRITKITCPTQPYAARGGYQAIPYTSTPYKSVPFTSSPYRTVPYTPAPLTYSNAQAGAANGATRVVTPQTLPVRPQPVTPQTLPVPVRQTTARPAYQPVIQAFGTAAQRQVVPVQRQLPTLQTVQRTPMQAAMLQQAPAGPISTAKRQNTQV